MKIKQHQKRLSLVLLIVALITSLLGCNQPNNANDAPSALPSSSENMPYSESNIVDILEKEDIQTSTSSTSTQLYVKFGDDGIPINMYLYDNETAAAISHHVGTADWRIPLYNYNDYNNWEVMQYYDIPSRYEIPSNPQAVTEEKAGTVYYSEPNRIVLFYGDAQVSGQYTPVGYFDANQEFVSAVENNPVLEGWGNKIIHISANQ